MAARGACEEPAAALSGKRYTHHAIWTSASAQRGQRAGAKSAPPGQLQDGSVAIAGSEIAISLLPSASSAATTGGQPRAPSGERRRARAER
jgi:hypothetical protein